jgi:hypothetical protein
MTTTTEIQTRTDAPDVTTYYAVHTAIRQGAHRLAAAAAAEPAQARTKAIEKYWKGYAAELHAHHTTEDMVFFPALVERAPEAAALIEQTDVDHARLDELMTIVTEELAAVQRGAGFQVLRRTLVELAELMDRHLDLEDAEIIPLFVRDFTATEYEAMEKQAIKQVGLGPQAAFAIPFIAESVTPEVRAELLANAPGAFRVLYRVSRGRYVRMEDALRG